MTYKPTAWNKTTGIKATRLFSHSEDPDLKIPGNKEKWVGFRRSGIGGSDIGAIAGVNPFSSAIDVYLEKRGELTVEENEKMKWGSILEQPVAEEYANTQGVKVNRVNAILQHTEIPYFLVNLDRLIVKNGQPLTPELYPSHRMLCERGNGLLEVKTTGWAKAWHEEEVPDMYMAQAQWEMLVSKLSWLQFAVLISGQELQVTPPISYNPKIGAHLTRLGQTFWNDCVLKGRVPEVDHNPATRESMRRLFPEVHEETMSLSESLNGMIRDRIKLNASIKTAETQKATIDSKILSAMGNNKWGKTTKYKVTRVLRAGSYFNKKAFKESHADLFVQYSEPSESIYPLYKAVK